MKPDIHPVYPPSRILCACGNLIETRSTRGSFHVEICSNCHPFFTGKYKLVDTAGRVERFRKKYGAAATVKGAEKGAAASGAEAGGAEPVAAAKAEKAPAKAKAPKAPKAKA